MNTYEKLIKQEKRYRARFRFDSPQMFILPIIVAATFVITMFLETDVYDKVKAAMLLVLTVLLYIVIILAVRLTDCKGHDPKKVEYDFEAMFAEAGVFDPESFNETLEKMACYEKHIFMDHKYFLDFRSLKVVPVISIVNVHGFSEVIKRVRHIRSRTVYYVMMTADVSLKIRCRNQSSQEELLRALNLAIIENNHMRGKAGSIQKSKFDILQTCGDAEMDDLNTDQLL